MEIRYSCSTIASHFWSAAFAAPADIALGSLLVDTRRIRLNGLLVRDHMAELGIGDFNGPQGVFGDLRRDGGDSRDRIALKAQLFDSLTEDRFDPLHLLRVGCIDTDHLRAGVRGGED